MSTDDPTKSPASTPTPTHVVMGMSHFQRLLELGGRAGPAHVPPSEETSQQEDVLAEVKALLQELGEPVDPSMVIVNQLTGSDGFYAILSDEARARQFDESLPQGQTVDDAPEEFRSLIAYARAMALARTPAQRRRVDAQKEILDGEDMIRRSMDPLSPEAPILRPAWSPEEETDRVRRLEKAMGAMDTAFDLLFNRKGVAAEATRPTADFMSAFMRVYAAGTTVSEEERTRMIDDAIAKMPPEMKGRAAMEEWLRASTREEAHAVHARAARASGEEMIRHGKEVLALEDSALPVVALPSQEEALTLALTRHTGLLAWLQKQHAAVFEEQLHTRSGTSERAYWHHGYMMALTDLLRALGKVDPGEDGVAYEPGA